MDANQEDGAASGESRVCAAPPSIDQDHRRPASPPGHPRDSRIRWPAGRVPVIGTCARSSTRTDRPGPSGKVGADPSGSCTVTGRFRTRRWGGNRRGQAGWRGGGPLVCLAARPLRPLPFCSPRGVACGTKANGRKRRTPGDACRRAGPERSRSGHAMPPGTCRFPGGAAGPARTATIAGVGSAEQCDGAENRSRQIVLAPCLTEIDRHAAAKPETKALGDQHVAGTDRRDRIGAL